MAKIKRRKKIDDRIIKLILLFVAIMIFIVLGIILLLKTIFHNGSFLLSFLYLISAIGITLYAKVYLYDL